MGGGMSHLKIIKEPWPTITFLDWDDTLFPTTWLSGMGILRDMDAETLAEVDAETLAELEKLDEASCSMLASVCRLSTRTCIVTNALKTGWVTQSASIFMPKLHALLESPNGPTIVYAKDKQNQKYLKHFGRSRGPEQLTPDEFALIMTNAKVLAMQPEIESFYSMYPQRHWQNIVSIGDGTSERNAIKEITFVHEQLPGEKMRTKVIKMLSDPTSNEVISQLQNINKHLSAIIHFNGDLDVDFENENANERLAEASLAEALHTLFDEATDKTICDAMWYKLKKHAPETTPIIPELPLAAGA